MTISLELLRSGGSCYSVEESDVGFLLYVVPGDEANFYNIVRRLVDESGESYVALPRTDGNGSYDCVLIIPH